MENTISLSALDWIIVIVFIAFMIYVGFYFHKRKKGFNDYFMAGRSLTAPLLVGTLVSTFYGLLTLFGTSEIGYLEGISAFFAYSLPYTLLYVVMTFLAPKFKEKFPEGATMQGIIFDKYGKGAGTVASIASFIYCTNTAEMMGVGFMLHLMAGIPFWLGTLIGAVIVVVYTYTGGLWAVTLTDFIQFIFMMVTVSIALILAWRNIGGYAGVMKGLAGFTDDPDLYFRFGAGYLTPWVLIAYSLTAIAVLCEPAFFQRIFAAGSPKEIKKAFGVAVPMWLSFDWSITFLGIVAAAAVGLGRFPELHPNEALFAVVGQTLPVGLLGIFVAGVFACTLSSSDSYFLVSGGIIGYDIYSNVINTKATDAQKEKYTKMGIIISAVISLSLAFFFDQLMGVWVFQATFIVSTTLIPVYVGVFAKRKPTKAAGLAATLTGLGGSIFWYLATVVLGTYNEDWATFTFSIGRIEFWQEYGIIVLVPIVAAVFFITNALTRKKEEALA